MTDQVNRTLLRPRPRLPLRVIYSRRSRHASMGRFGGGWQWVLGFEAGGRHRNGQLTVILNLLVAMVRVTWRPTRRLGA